MKQLAVYFSAVAVLLLLLPLPALNITGTAQSSQSAVPETRPSGTSRFTAASSRKSDAASLAGTTAAAEPEQAVFRVQLGEEIREVEERAFLRAILTCEMPLSYSEEALKAQAVASYTYFCRQREEARAAGEAADFSDVPSRFEQCSTQAGLRERLGADYDTCLAKLNRVIEAVYGYTIRYNGQKIVAAYHAISAGVTESGETVWAVDYPYLQAVPSPGDKEAEKYITRQTFTEQEVKAAFAAVKDIAFDEKPQAWFGQIQQRENGLVTGLTVGGVAQTGAQVRKALDLRSANFTVSYQEGSFVFTVKGYGHGVGLSQYGAQCLAQQGADWQEILHHYYTDVTLEK